MVRLHPKFSIVSFTFDDFPRSALRIGGDILKRYGVRGTYYVSLGLMGRQSPAGPSFLAEDLRQLLAEGHELGCHTFAHCNAWETRPSVFEQSVIENKRALEELVPGAVFKTLSYPIILPRPQTKRLVAKHFVCCRGGGEALDVKLTDVNVNNARSRAFNVGRVDANNLRTYFLEKCRDNPGMVRNLIDENFRVQGWLIFATHDVSLTPSPCGCTPSFFENIVHHAVNSGSRLLPVAEAWEAIRAAGS